MASHTSATNSQNFRSLPDSRRPRLPPNTIRNFPRNVPELKKGEKISISYSESSRASWISFKVNQEESLHGFFVSLHTTSNLQNIDFEAKLFDSSGELLDFKESVSSKSGAILDWYFVPWHMCDFSGQSDEMGPSMPKALSVLRVFERNSCASALNPGKTFFKTICTFLS